MLRIGIFGASGMARDAADIAYDLGYSPIYIVRDKYEIKNLSLDDDVIHEDEVEKYCDMSFVIGVGDNNIRHKIAQRFSGKIKFANLIHSNATFGYKQREITEKQRGLIICAGVRLTNNITIGDFCILNQNATIAHDVIIKDYVHVAPGSIISGNVFLESKCWIGAGAVINQGRPESKLRIGLNSVVGSGAVVLSSCEDNSVYAGVPARKIK